MHHHCRTFSLRGVLMALTQVQRRLWCPPHILHHRFPSLQLEEVMFHNIIFIVYVTCSPVPLAMAWDPPSESSAHGTRYPENQWAPPPFSQHVGSDIDAQGPAITPFLGPYGDPQASNLAAVQSQLHLDQNNTTVPEVRGFAPTDWLVPPYGSGVEQQQPIPYDYTENINSHDDFASASPMSSGSSDEMSDNSDNSDNEWTGILHLDGTRVPVRALMDNAVGDLYVHACFRQMRLSRRFTCMQRIIRFVKRIGC
jgi:hypothetical protein